MKELLWVLLVLFGGLALLLLVTLLTVRSVSGLLTRRTTARKDELRHLLLTALLGEDDEADRAKAVLLARRGPAWDSVEEQVFTMLPKLKGDSHDDLVRLLVRRGAVGRALRRARSRSLVRRSRGAYQLGTLGQHDTVPALLDLLHDKHFLVRRVTVRALGAVGDPAAVTPMLDAVTTDPTLTRDVMAALRRIGPPAAVPLRHELAQALDGTSEDRRAALVATALGLLADLPSTALLVRAVATGAGHPGLPAAAAEALGLIGAPEAVDPLVAVLAETDADLRIAAARALGRISDPRAVPGLSRALDGTGHESDRAVAAALLRLGTPGLRALESHASPYASEALAVHQVRVGV